MTTLELRLIGYALAALAVAGLLFGFVHHERTLGAQHERQAVAKAADAASAAAAAETQRRVAAQQEVVHDAELQADAARADADRARRAGDALRVQLAAIRRDHLPGNPASTPGGDSDPIGVLAEVLGSVDDAGRSIAAEADRNRIGWDACVRAYGALTP